MTRTDKPDEHLHEQRKCAVCGSWIKAQEAECGVCRHDGMDPQEYAALFWDEV